MPTNLDETVDMAALSKLRSWIVATKQSSTEMAEIEMDTNLIGEGVLDSLEMVNFLLYIEELRGKEIPETLIQPDNFVSLRVIYDTFFSPTKERQHASHKDGF